MGKLKSSKDSSKVLLQAMFDIQNCANKECPSRPEDCWDCRKFDSSFKHVFEQIKRWKEGLQTCPQKIDQFVNQLNVTAKLDAVFDTSLNVTAKIQQFINVFSKSLRKSVKSIAPVEKHLLACCPCGQSNHKGCDEEAIKKSTASVTCPLELLNNSTITNLLQSIEKEIYTPFPYITFYIDVPAANFEINVPRYIQGCFGSSSFGLRFTKLCSLHSKSWYQKIRSPITPDFKKLSFNLTSSLPEDIDLSCKEVKKSFGKLKMPDCGDRAASFCGRLSSDYDQFYCKISDVTVKNGIVKCDSNYTFHDSKCVIVPDHGFRCGVEVIKCMKSGYRAFWDHSYISCYSSFYHQYPVCTCKNNDTFIDGKKLCQYGNFEGVAPTPVSALELRKTSNCFERLNLYKDIKEDCGASMSPCVIKKPYKININPNNNNNNNINSIGRVIGTIIGVIIAIIVCCGCCACICSALGGGGGTENDNGRVIGVAYVIQYRERVTVRI